MKNKKGFTFVEMLGVVTILGVLALITIPTVERITKENKEKIYQTQLDNIVLSLKSWASDNKVDLPTEEGEILKLTLGNLKAEGYIEYNVKNPKTNKCFSNDTILEIKRVNKTYEYKIDLDTLSESNICEVDIYNPTIILNGDTIEKIEVNQVYVELSATARDKDGNDITDKIVTKITGTSNVIDTSKIGNKYIIYYSVTDNNKTVSISRTVEIVDTIAPDIIVPNNVDLSASDTSFDIMEGVSATDNSGENIEVTAKNNIVFGIKGTYTITYTATDSTGNTATKKRIVTISE